MYYSELKNVVGSLQNRLGRSLTGIWQPSRDALILGLGHQDFLLIVPKGALSRIHTIPKRLKNPPTPFSFQGACRAHLHGRLRTLTLNPNDREIFIAFDTGELTIRMVGRNGGIWLKSDGCLIASLQGPAPEILEPLPKRPVLDNAPRFTPSEDEDWNRAALRWYTTQTTTQSREERIQALHKQLGRQIKKKERLLQNLKDDLSSADNAEHYRQIGDLLGIHLHKVKHGINGINLANPYRDNQTTFVKLNPSKSPAENMNWYYGKSRRLERAGLRILEAMEAAEAHLINARTTRDKLPFCTAGELKDLENQYQIGWDVKTRAKPVSKLWYTWTGPQGQQILIGKNETGNRRLITQKGRGDDIWMHIRQRPGPHVLILMKRGKTPDLDTLLTGGQIAVLHAKLEQGEVVDVQYAQLRHIRPIPGDQLGRVTVQKEKVLQIQRNQHVLADWSRD